MQPPVVTPLIRRLATQRGLDPRAVIAVAQGEGGLQNRAGDIGDLSGGGSYGPFQMYTKGALPAQYRGRPEAADQWAWSKGGIGYALDQMVKVGAAGLQGQGAVRKIITDFERPYDPGKSIANALGRLPGIQAGAGRPLPQVVAGRGGGLPPQPVPRAAPQIPLPPAQPSRNLRKDALLQGLIRGDDIYDLIASLPQNAPSAPAPRLTRQLASMPVRAPVRGLQGMQPRTAAKPVSTPQAAAAPESGFGLEEMFHDPLGGIDNGTEIGAIGGHGKHVHSAFKTPEGLLRAAKLAQSLGLAVKENPRFDPVDPVHTKGSFHYQTFPGTNIGKAIDVSGDPEAMKTYYRTIAAGG